MVEPAKTKPMNLRVPPETVKRVDAMAARRQVDRSEMIRRLVDRAWASENGGAASVRQAKTARDRSQVNPIPKGQPKNRDR